MNRQELNNLSEKIIKAAITVHKQLGPGLLEHVYSVALMYELKLNGMNALAEVSIPIIYKGITLSTAYRADIIVENEIILELKATENDNPLYAKQLLTYLRLSNKRVGLLLNFNRMTLTEGITRVVNQF